MTFNTFLSCDTRSNNVCLNRTEGVPQVVSPVLADPIAIERRVGCSAAAILPPASKTVPVPAGYIPTQSSAPVPKKERFTDSTFYLE